MYANELHIHLMNGRRTQLSLVKNEGDLMRSYQISTTILAGFADRRSTKQYRSYLLNDAGDILKAVEFETSDDEQAQRTAWALLGEAHKAQDGREATGIEVWDGKRLIFSSHPRRG